MAVTDDKQITCRFMTKLPAQYRIPATDIAVPASLTRYGLSQVVNHLLEFVTEEKVPFDFLIDGELVRQPLDKFLLAQKISAESVLDVEYILAVAPPRLSEEVLHDDWVSALDGSLSGQIYSGCYDGMLRIWDGSGAKLAEAPIHKGPISALQVITGQRQPILLSAGKLDYVARLSQVPSDPAQLRQGGVDSVAVFKGHSGSILNIAAAPGHTQFATASQDKTLRIWPISSEAIEASSSEPEEGVKRKKRKAGLDKAIDAQAIEVGPVSELAGHSDAVTSTIWAEPGTIYSGSMDHSVRRWDPETETNVDILHCKRGIYGLSSSALNPSIIAFAGASKALQLWDVRQKHSEAYALKSFSSHSSFIHAVAWRPESQHHVATGSMDKTSKLWDIRSSIPLCTLDGHTEQVLCLAWWGGSKIVSGSADKTIRIYDSDF